MSYSRITIEDVRKIIQDSMEDTDTPDKILVFLKKYEGKPFTKRIVEAYRAEFATKNVSLVNCLATYFKVENIDLIVSHDTKHVKVDTKFIEEKNQCYFEAAKLRNRCRAASLEDNHAMEAMAHAVQNINENMGTFRSLTEYGKGELYTNRFDFKLLFTDDYLKNIL